MKKTSKQVDKQLSKQSPKESTNGHVSVRMHLLHWSGTHGEKAVYKAHTKGDQLSYLELQQGLFGVGMPQHITVTIKKIGTRRKI